MTTVLLLTISEERKQQELRRVGGHAEPVVRARTLGLALLCSGWLLLGLALVGLSFHLNDGDRAQAALLAGLLVGNGGPSFTLIFAHWLEQQR